MRAFLIVSAAMFFASTSGAAQDTPEVAVNYAAMSDDALHEYLRTNAERVFQQPCDGAMLFAELRKRDPKSVLYLRGDLVVRAYCAAERDQPADALNLLRTLENEYDMPGQDGFGLYLALRTDDAEEVLTRLRSMALSGELVGLSDQQCFEAFRVIRRAGMYDELSAFGAEVTGMEVFPRLDPSVRASLATGALRHAVAAGDLSDTERLLAEIRSPGSYIEILASRDYAPVWPAIERHAGDHLVNVSGSYVTWAAQWLADSPEDRDRLSEYAHSLLFAGRFEEAVALTHSWLGDAESYEGIAEGDAWALNIEAYALDRLGKYAAADRVFDRLAALPADENPWVVNFVINRASRLVGQERWDEGLEATVLARAVAEEYGSTYAKMLIARDRACALHRLGRPDEAEVEIAYLVEQFNESGDVAASGLLCAGDEDRVVTLLAGALADEVARRTLVSELQHDRFELFYTASKLPRAREVILAREELRETALAEVRILPEQFVPQANLGAPFAPQGRSTP